MKAKSLYLIVALAMPTGLPYDHVEGTTERPESPSAQELNTIFGSNHRAEQTLTVELRSLAEDPCIEATQETHPLDIEHARRRPFHKTCYKKIRHFICPGITAIIIALIVMYDPRTRPIKIDALEEVIEYICLTNNFCATLPPDQRTLVIKTIANEYLEQYSMPLQGCFSYITTNHFSEETEAKLSQRHPIHDYTEEKLRMAGQSRRKPLYIKNRGRTVAHAKSNSGKHW